MPTRSGGFGGADGLAAYLREQQIDLLIDATHPYAAQHLAQCRRGGAAAGVPIFALRRPGWEPAEGDRWTLVADAAEAVKRWALRRDASSWRSAGRRSPNSRRRRSIAYLIRSVDPVEPPLDVPDATYILARGPFARSGRT